MNDKSNYKSVHSQENPTTTTDPIAESSDLAPNLVNVGEKLHIHKKTKSLFTQDSPTVVNTAGEDNDYMNEQELIQKIESKKRQKRD